MAFRKPAGHSGATPRNGTCDVRGLTHDWALSRRGFGVITRRSARQRCRRPKQSLWRWCRANRHAPLKDQYPRLCLKWRGHLRYYGMQGNFRLLEEVLRSAEKAWRYWLSRRSSTSAIGGEKFQQLLETSVLPTPRIVHNISWAMQGSTVMHQSRAGTLAPEEPDAFMAHVRVCGGAGWVTTGSTRKPTAPSGSVSYAGVGVWGRQLTAGVRCQKKTSPVHRAIQAHGRISSIIRGVVRTYPRRPQG